MKKKSLKLTRRKILNITNYPLNIAVHDIFQNINITSTEQMVFFFQRQLCFKKLKMHQNYFTYFRWAKKSKLWWTTSTSVHADMKNRLILILFQIPECPISLPFLWIWQNIVVIQLQIEKHYFMRWFHLKSRGGVLLWFETAVLARCVRLF